MSTIILMSAIYLTIGVAVSMVQRIRLLRKVDDLEELTKMLIKHSYGHSQLFLLKYQARIAILWLPIIIAALILTIIDMTDEEDKRNKNA